MSTLNHEQRMFVHYFLNDAKDDAVKAARMAGYRDPGKAASALLRSKKVCGYLEQKLEESGAMSVAEILARLSTIASLDVMEFVEFREETNRAGDTAEKPFLDLRRVKKLKKGNLIKDLKIHPSGAIEVKFHDAVEAMDKLAKYHGMFKERIEIEHINGDAGSERIVAILGGLAQLAGAINAGTPCSEPEPGGLCDRGEQWEVDASPAPSVDQPALALGGPEGDRETGDHARSSDGKERADIEILPGVDDRPEAG